MAATLAWPRPGPAPVRLGLAAGRAEGARFRVAAVLAREAQRAGVTVALEDTPGSIASLDRVDAAPGRLALVQGGRALALELADI